MMMEQKGNLFRATGHTEWLQSFAAGIFSFNPVQESVLFLFFFVDIVDIVEYTEFFDGV